MPAINETSTVRTSSPLMKKNCTLYVVPTPPNLSKETGLVPRFEGPSLLDDKGVTLCQSGNFENLVDLKKRGSHSNLQITLVGRFSFNWFSSIGTEEQTKFPKKNLII